MRFPGCWLLVWMLTSACVPGRVSAPVSPPLAAATHPLGSLQALEEMRDAFCARLSASGLEPPYLPQMWEWTRPSLISWREEVRAVAVPRWDELDAATRQMFSSCGGRRCFQWAFRWFFPVHELAHFVQVEMGWQGDHAAAERMANDLAVAFLAERPGGLRRLKTFGRMVEKAARELADPTPFGQDPDAHFNAHYHQLGQNPRAYGAYQWKFVLHSLRRAGSLGFGDLVAGMVREGPVPTAIMLDPSLDVGFHVAAHLHLPEVAITLFDPRYVKQVADVRKQLGIPDLLLQLKTEELASRLNTAWRVHRLVRLPALFLDFADTRQAFDLLLGETEANLENETIRRRLKTFLLDRYPYLEHLSGQERLLGRELAAIIEYEYDSFFKGFHHKYREKWDWARRTFRSRWYREVSPAVAVLDPKRSIRQVVVVLSPALRRHGKSYRICSGIARAATLLPENPSDMNHALLYALHELSHGITDPYVYALGHRRQELSFKHGDKGKALHMLIEAAANQAMFEALGRTNPDLQEVFLKQFGNLAWLADENLLEQGLKLAGRPVSGDQCDRLRRGLETKPHKTSRSIYERGLLVPEGVLGRLRTTTTHH